MKNIFRIAAGAWIALAVGSTLSAAPVAAGDYNGNFMIRLQGTEVVTQDKLKSLTALPGTDLKAAGFGATVSDTFIPTATLTYFVNKNLSLELFCCFSKHHIDLQAPAGSSALTGRVADSWIFPPAVTLQYHFDGMGVFKPYVGAGAQWIHFFNSTTANNTLGATSVGFGDAFGPVIQAGVDVQIGNGWYLNADVKKSWLDTKVTWRNSSATGGDIVGKSSLDPLTISAGIGYRFNLDDVFGRRSAVPLK